MDGGAQMTHMEDIYDVQAIQSRIVNYAGARTESVYGT